MSKLITASLVLILLIAAQAYTPSFAHSDANNQHHCHHDGAKGYLRCH